MNPFNWKQASAARPTQFAADPNYRTPLYSKWRQTAMTIPWEQYRDERDDEAKLERRVHAVSEGGHAQQSLGPLSGKRKSRAKCGGAKK